MRFHQLIQNQNSLVASSLYFANLRTNNREKPLLPRLQRFFNPNRLRQTLQKKPSNDVRVATVKTHLQTTVFFMIFSISAGNWFAANPTFTMTHRHLRRGLPIFGLNKD